MPVDKSEQRVRQMFGEIAERYDLLNHLLSLNVDRYWRWQTVRRVPPGLKGPILDICTGTADLALAYHKAALGHVPIIAADFSHPMLVRGDQKGRQIEGRRNLHFVEADAQQLPFDDAQFQLVTVAFGLRNVTNTDQGLREMARVCRPGGKVAVLEFSMPTQPGLKQLYQFYFRHVLPRIGQTLARNRSDAYNYLPSSVQEFPSGEALCDRMRGAGLSTARHVPLTLGVATLYIGTK
ncbi:MAG: bifunctional demethylmenaquinone methyltransferase/2-methoxy-6-polyprenyl-1,4-benzoquinol methylase UbiE [Pirellulales bacterium]|nr:bifunctional demethylmenaquinone methyltransferase/2-methoxy-6-polyprenyl-1,4-benzoquinol methylase UbiE [Pirellulales bacterium]